MAKSVVFFDTEIGIDDKKRGFVMNPRFDLSDKA